MPKTQPSLMRTSPRRFWIANEATIALGEERAHSGTSREHMRAKCAETYQREIQSQRGEP